MSNKEQINRPVIVSVTLYALAFAGIAAIIYSFTGAFAPYGIFYPAAQTLIIVGMFASFAGIGSMERWGLYLFLVMLALKFGLDVYAGAFSPFVLLLLIPCGIFVSQFRKMK